MQQTQELDRVAQVAIDCGWFKTHRFTNLNGDRCIRVRWQKGTARKERAIYFAVNVDTGEVVDCRAIEHNRELPELELTADAAIEAMYA